MIENKNIEAENIYSTLINSENSDLVFKSYNNLAVLKLNSAKNENDFKEAYQILKKAICQKAQNEKVFEILNGDKYSTEEIENIKNYLDGSVYAKVLSNLCLSLLLSNYDKEVNINR